MYVWIMYDISNHKTRRKVAKHCKQLGLQRVQRSVFVGKTRKKRLKQFREEVATWLNVKTDCLYILHSSKEAFRQVKTIGSMPAIPLPGEVFLL
jgi:CRISPR-associated protein Cas2